MTITSISKFVRTDVLLLLIPMTINAQKDLSGNSLPWIHFT